MFVEIQKWLMLFQILSFILTVAIWEFLKYNHLWPADVLVNG